MKKRNIFINLKNDSKIEIQRRTNENYTHTVNIDAKIISVTTWRKSKLKFRLNLITNIFTLGILHVYSLFNPKLYLKIYCKQSLPRNSDYFLVEDIYKNYTLCKTIYSKSSKRKVSYASNSQNNRKNNLSISFMFNSIKYQYDIDSNSITPIYFNLSQYKNSTITNSFFEGVNSSEKYKTQLEKYGKNIMNLNIKLIYENFLFNDLPQCIIVFLSGGICLICGITIFGILLMGLSLLIIVIKLLYRYVIFIKKLGNDYSLDGIVEYRVKRKYMSEKKIHGYTVIKNIDLVPGDIISLSEGETLPCDGIILEGECVLSESKIMGKVDDTIRYALEKDNNYFNYEKNRNSIVFHGAEILKIYSKHSYKYIIVLVINTGSNTFKANQFSNLLYNNILNKRNNVLNGHLLPMYYLIYILIIYLISTISIVIRYLNNGKKISITNYAFLILGLAFMPIYYITSCSIKFLGIFNLNKDQNQNIQCIDESRLIESGKINRVIFDKTGTLTEKQIDISAFMPLYYDNSTSKLYFKVFEKKNIKKISEEHSMYYRNYLFQKKDEFHTFRLNNQESMADYDETLHDKSIIKDNNKYELCSLFLHCIICCTNLAKINNEICGNIMEKELIKMMKWDINTVEIVSEGECKDEDCSNLDNPENIIDKIHRIGSIFFNNANNISNNYNYNSLNVISEVFPRNYYKITEGTKLLKRKNTKINVIKDANKKIKKLNSFKLIIITRFFNHSYMNISCIVYNFIEDNYRFMTKGPHEKVLKYCRNASVPDIEKILSKALKEGYKVMACATKIIKYSQNDRNKKEDYYLKDLTFCGFIFLKHNLKEESYQIIKTIKKMECDVSISTGDIATNSIGAGLEIDLFNAKNLFVLDIDNNGKRPKLIVSCISNDIKFDEDKEKESEKDKKSIDTIKTKRTRDEDRKNFNFYNDNMIHRKLSNRSGDKNSKSSKFNTKKNYKRLNFFSSNNNYNNNEEKSSNRELIENKDTLFNNNELSKIDENLSDSINKMDTYHFEEADNSPISYFNEEDNKNVNKSKISGKPSYASLLNVFESSSKSIKNKLSIGKEKSNQNLDKIEEFHLDSSTPMKEPVKEAIKSEINKKKSRNTKNDIENIGFFREEKKSIHFSINVNTIHKGSKFFKRNRRFTSKENLFYCDILNYQPNIIPKKIVFDYSINKIHYFTEGCTLCFSGMALRYIYEKRKNLEIKILLKLMNKFGRVFFSMSSFEKALLIKINREIFNKKICMVGDGFNDIDAIMSSDVGIFIGQQKNLNTLLSHYFIDEHGLMNIERIIKNGRGYYENDNLLLPVNVCFTSLWLLLIIYSYYIEILVNSMMLSLLNLSVFILCVVGFSITPDYDINYNYLASNEKLLRFYNFLKIFATFIIKALSHIIIYFVYKYNDNIELSRNRQIYLSYIFLIIWAQSMSIVFSFNINTFYRKTILSNFIFLMIYIMFLAYILCLLTINDISLGNSDGYITLTFEFSKIHLDYLDDTHKLFVLYLILVDLSFSCIFFLILKKLFLKIANNYKQNQQNKKKKE